jgi:hypothetical protein
VLEATVGKPLKKNDEVIDAFYRKKELRNKNLKSGGTSLWSYEWWEMARGVKGKVILRNGLSYSRTTEVLHRRGLKGKPAKQTAPREQAEMNV